MTATRMLAILALALPFAAAASEPAARPGAPARAGQAPGRLPPAGTASPKRCRASPIIPPRAGSRTWVGAGARLARGPPLSHALWAPRSPTAPISPAITRSPPGAAAMPARGGDRRGAQRPGLLPAAAARGSAPTGSATGTAAGRCAIAACASAATAGCSRSSAAGRAAAAMTAPPISNGRARRLREIPVAPARVPPSMSGRLARALGGARPADHRRAASLLAGGRQGADRLAALAQPWLASDPPRHPARPRHRAGPRAGGDVHAGASTWPITRSSSKARRGGGRCRSGRWRSPISTLTSWRCSRDAGHDVRIHAAPNEIDPAIPFAEDKERRAYDPDSAAPPARRAARRRPRLPPVPLGLPRQGEPGPFLLGQLRSRRHPLLRPAGAAPPGRHPQPARRGHPRGL